MRAKTWYIETGSMGEGERGEKVFRHTHTRWLTANANPPLNPALYGFFFGFFSRTSNVGDGRRVVAKCYRIPERRRRLNTRLPRTKASGKAVVYHAPERPSCCYSGKECDVVRMRSGAVLQLAGWERGKTVTFPHLIITHPEPRTPVQLLSEPPLPGILTVRRSRSDRE